MKESAFVKARLDEPFKGVLFVIAGVSVFLLQDVAIKWMSPNYPMYEIVFVRSLVAIPPILLIARLEGGLSLLRTRRPWMHLLRSSVMLMAYTTYYLALAALPLADTVALFFSGPLFVTALSVPFLGETVRLDRWLAVLVGFLGVMIMLRPGAGMVDPAAFLPILAAFSYAIVAIVTRRLGTTEAGSSMAFYSTVVYLMAGGVLGAALGDRTWAGGGHASLQFLLRPWVLPSGPDLALMGLCGVVAAFGLYALSQAYRVARVSTVAPFEYTGLPMAVLWGYVFWKDLPDGYTITGAVLVVGAGLYVLRQEAVRKRAPVNGPPLEE
jgi:drug/metabolite transporter (DMT)-like permease